MLPVVAVPDNYENMYVQKGVWKKEENSKLFRHALLFYRKMGDAYGSRINCDHYNGLHYYRGNQNKKIRGMYAAWILHSGLFCISG